MIHELDAVVAHLYGLSEAQVGHIFETFHEGWDHDERLSEVLRHYRDLGTERLSGQAGVHRQPRRQYAGGSAGARRYVHRVCRRTNSG